MNLPLKKALSVLALSAILFVSLISVCKQMVAPCGDCLHQAVAGIVQISAVQMNQADGCAQNVARCVMGPDQMVVFSGIYPTIAVSGFLALAIIGVVSLFWLRRIWDLAAENGRLKVKVKSLRWRLIDACTPDFLVAAFSRGILHSKIYA